ncbi:hypothetical protein LOZ58_005228 [Ophidiomyces ophidiicola]|nr:hypothetical protein LOZ65_000074 [Ophidiomyces ophidiicola]KAI1934357.1 hypothetical protein LOZ66_006067 [Ophidiomyces ophidiicola]KAI1958113.1 hypothetical protein LOZ58_005228 [Ophidiomyces ophidiicola]
MAEKSKGRSLPQCFRLDAIPQVGRQTYLYARNTFPDLVPMSTDPVRLPNGYVLAVTPVFGGMTFKNNNINLSHSVLPPGWNIVIQTDRSAQADGTNRPESALSFASNGSSSGASRAASGSRPQTPAMGSKPIPRGNASRFTVPTRDSDSLFISSIFLPSSSDFKPASSPTREIAMLLWATLFWYFHLPEPNLRICTPEASLTPESGRPKGDWRVYIRREGVFKGRHLLQKLERMGLVTSSDSSVGLDPADPNYQDIWGDVYVSRRSFWQLDPRIFLFTLQPAAIRSGVDSPHFSRPASPSREFGMSSPKVASAILSPEQHVFHPSLPGGPFYSASHLPTYFPPAPAHFITTNGVRHPARPKPPRQGETFYVRYVRSVGQTLSFRVPVLSPRDSFTFNDIRISHRKSSSTTSLIDGSSVCSPLKTDNESDLDILHRWMNNSRINAAWGAAGPRSTQEAFLRKQFASRYSFPVFGCWNGKPFGYFEIYWIKESNIARLLATPVGNWDRGFHCLIGEDEYRSDHRVQIWMSALVHFCWLADSRTENVILEPRVDNDRFISNLQEAGFYKEGEVTFPHKQAAVMKISRDNWEVPAL